MTAVLFECPSDIELPEWLHRCMTVRETAGMSDASFNLQDASLVCSAFQFAYQLHKGQCRASGEPYINHPVAVAGLLRDLGGSATTVAAGFLHDIVEDTDVTPEEIEHHFGAEVRFLVEGVTKLSKMSFSSKTERQAENLRRMFVAMAKDIRVVVVKLADRLHNMRTLEHLEDSKRRRIAQETRDIFAPLANRLGIGRFKWELEDLAFKYLEPLEYRQMQELIAEKRGDREARLENAARMLKERLEEAGVHCLDINGRPKHLYGIYRKMQQKGKAFHEIYDIAALRIIVETNPECYRALAVVHDAFRPIPGRFKDYIGLPKPNRYQSLHTGVIGTSGRPIEVQIRTMNMHRIAEYGIAAHWKYKEAGGKAKLTNDDEKFTWLRQLLEWQNDLSDAQEYLDSLKDNLFEDEVYVFTPRGDVMCLSRGATTVDFAYRIHTEVGNHCAGAKINDRIMPLDTELQNGDIVEILTQKNSHPSMDWLKFVVTPSARNRIRQWLRRSHRDENILRGRELLEKELGRQGFEALLKSDPMLEIAKGCNYHSTDDLLAALGYGEVALKHVLNRLRDLTLEEEPTEELPLLQQMDGKDPSTADPNISKSNPIAGIEGLLHRIAGCCTPIPGEPIIGVVTQGGDRCIAIHRQGCPNVRTNTDRLVPVSWNARPQRIGRPQTYPIRIQVEVLDRVGVLKDVLSRLTDRDINVRNAKVRTFAGKPALIDLCIDIRDRHQLDCTFNQIRQMSDVLSLRRLSQMND